MTRKEWNLFAVLCPTLLLVQGILLALSGGIACLLHVLLYTPLFSRINLYDFAYSPIWYGEAMFLTLVLSFSVMLLYLKCRIGNYAVVNFRRNRF